MKALIMDEHGDFASIIDGSEEIINNLKEYLLEFDKYGHSVCWGTEEFVNYLNEVILKDKNDKVVILDLYTNKYDKNLPTLRI